MSRKEKRFDKNRRVLRTGETVRKNGTYQYSYFEGTERKCAYAHTLDELREKEALIEKNKFDGIRTSNGNKPLNDFFTLWRQAKDGLRENTAQNYCFLYNSYCRDSLGLKPVSRITKNDVKLLYKHLKQNKGLKPSTIDSLHNVLYQVFQCAVDERVIRDNPAIGAMADIRKKNKGEFREEKRALTEKQTEVFLNYLKTTPKMRNWYPIFAVFFGTGLRVGELTGLRWSDIDFNEGNIRVTHTLSYYQKEDGKCGYEIHDPKTAAGRRTIPMLDEVREALLEHKSLCEQNGLKCESIIDGYKDFVFFTRFNTVFNQGSLNKEIKRICRNLLEKSIEENNPDLIVPEFSCHTCRHTFCTRITEHGMNINVIQKAMGHSDYKLTMEVYTDVTSEFMKSQFETFNASKSM